MLPGEQVQRRTVADQIDVEHAGQLLVMVMGVL
jgi:hypothetical protein